MQTTSSGEKQEWHAICLLVFFALMKLAAQSTKRWQYPFQVLSDTAIKLLDILWINLVSSE